MNELLGANRKVCHFGAINVLVVYGNTSYYAGQTIYDGANIYVFAFIWAGMSQCVKALSDVNENNAILRTKTTLVVSRNIS